MQSEKSLWRQFQFRNTTTVVSLYGSIEACWLIVSCTWYEAIDTSFSKIMNAKKTVQTKALSIGFFDFETRMLDLGSLNVLKFG